MHLSLAGTAAAGDNYLYKRFGSLIFADLHRNRIEGHYDRIITEF